jgi:NitT/TauT family transport system substrate-binding protein
MSEYMKTSDEAGTTLTTRRSVLEVAGTAVMAAGSGLLTVSCGSSSESASGRTSVTFLAVLPMTTLTYAPELLADAGGYFTDQGLDVSFQSTRGTAQAIQLVLAGGAPLTRIGQIEAVSHAANRDAPILNVGTVVKQSTIRFVSSAASPLREPADFVGKTVGIPSEGGESETTLDLLLASSGIDPARVERQVVGVGPGVFNLVEQGRIAGFMVSIDTAKILEHQMSNVVVLNPGEFIESGAQLYMVAADALAENGDMIRRYLAAVRGAIDFMIADEGFDETLGIMRQKYDFGTLQNDEVAKASLAEYVRAWTVAGPQNILRTDPDRWRKGYEELVAAGQVAAGRDPGQWFTNDFVPVR